MDEQQPTKKSAHWLDHVDTRTRQHIKFAVNYKQAFAHGAPGHLDLLTIATLADMLEDLHLRGKVYGPSDGEQDGEVAHP